MAQELTHKAMLVHFNSSIFTARKHDKKASEDVATNFLASQKAGRYHKALISQEYLKPINQLVSEARKFHYQMTLPWHDDGARILPSAAYNRYNTKMRAWQQEFFTIRDDFVNNYQTYVTQAQQFLGNLYNSDDYPDEAEIKEKFAFTIKIDPLPVAKDFRVDLQSTEIDKVRQQIEKRTEEAKENAMSDLWNRLYTVVNHISERLNDPDKIFRNTLVGNTIELCNILPKLNIMNDPELESMRLQVENKLCSIDPGTLRSDSQARKNTANDADELLNAMKVHI